MFLEDYGMNILHYANYTGPYKGNFVQSLTNLDSKLNSNGDKMFWLLEDDVSRFDWPNELIEKGINLSFINAFKTNSIKKIREFILNNKIDVVHIHFISLRVLFTFYYALKGLKNVKYFVHLHNHFPNNKTVLRKHLLKNATFICCSDSVADGLCNLNFPKDRIKVVQNAIDFSRLDTNVDEEKYLKYFDNNSYKVLLFGFDFYRKGTDIALKAVNNLVKSGMNIMLYISVAANMEFVVNEIKKIFNSIPDWVVLLPPCNSVSIYYKNTDLFVSASREEGFCYALIEAAYCETEVAATKIPAQGDLKIPYCHWFDSESFDQLSSIIKKIYNGNNVNKLAQKQMVVKEYDIEQWSDKIIRIYYKADGD